jgi:hypothetical protein
MLVMQATAQITITSGDIDDAWDIGANMLIHVDSTYQQVDLGQQGGGNTWDFSAFSSDSADTMHIIAAQEGDSSSLFPNATHALKNEMQLESAELPSLGSVKQFTYLAITNTDIEIHGMVFSSSIMSAQMNYDNGFMSMAHYPATLGTQWTDSGTITTEYRISFMGIDTSSRDTIRQHISHEIDAWGSATMPDGNTYDVLRIHSIQKADTLNTTTYSYQFVTRDFMVISFSAGSNDAVSGTVTPDDVTWQRIEGNSGVDERAVTRSRIRTGAAIHTTAGHITITHPGYRQEHAQIRILNTHGAVVYARDDLSGTALRRGISVPTSSLAAGVYTLCIESERNSLHRRVHIVR